MKLKFRRVKFSQDLTDGDITKCLIMYFIPIVASALLQQLYNAVDAIIVGRFIGTEAIAAVGGSTSHLIHTLTMIFISVSIGFSVITGQYYGAKNDEQVKRSVSTSIIFSVLIGAVLTAVIVYFAPSILRFMNTPEETMDDASAYLRIYFSAIIATLVLNTESGILRAVGNSKDPLIYMIISCVINIILDIVFVVFFKWGIRGAAYATIIAQISNMIMATVKLLTEKSSYRLDVHYLVLDMNLLKRMLRIGVPAGLQNALYGVANMLIMASVNSLGTLNVAAWALTDKVDGVFWSSSSSANTAITGFVAQNYGARKTDRIKDGVISSFKLFVTMTVLMSLAIGVFGKIALSLFSTDQLLIDTTYTVMMYFVPYYFLWIGIDIMTGILNGVGDVTVPVIITAIGTCLVRILWVFFIFPLRRTMFNISLCFPVTWLITGLAIMVYFIKKDWFPKKTAFLKRPNVKIFFRKKKTGDKN